jgi:hypothetical protein
MFYCLRFETSLFFASYDSQGHGGGIRPRLHTGVKVKVMLRLTVPSASPPWTKAPIWGLRPDIYLCWTIAGLLTWGALSDERTGLSFDTRVSVRVTLRLTVSQSVCLGVELRLGLMTRY